MKNSICTSGFHILVVTLVLVWYSPAISQDTLKIVNDVTQLNPVAVNQILVPTTTLQIVAALKTHSGPISIGGGRYSMGGQTATEKALHIDMRSFDSIIHFSECDKEKRCRRVLPGEKYRNL